MSKVACGQDCRSSSASAPAAPASHTESMSKVACETAAALPDAAGAVQLCGRSGAGSDSGSPCADDAGAPADSVVLRVPDGVGLTLTHLLFGAALRRDGSTKGSSNPKAAAEAATRKGAPRADSRRSPATTAAASSSKTAAAVVIGVLPASKVVVAKERRARAPGGPGHAVVARASWRRPAAGARVFASEAVGPEPVSPKVSCFGAVLSGTERSAAAPPAGTEGQRNGCWASLRTALLGLCRDNNDLYASEPTPAPEPQRVAVMSPPPAVARLGDVKRLASRRWLPETMAPGTVF